MEIFEISDEEKFECAKSALRAERDLQRDILDDKITPDQVAKKIEEECIAILPNGISQQLEKWNDSCYPIMCRVSVSLTDDMEPPCTYCRLAESAEAGAMAERPGCGELGSDDENGQAEGEDRYQLLDDLETWCTTNRNGCV
jgi:hypothetical protein